MDNQPNPGDSLPLTEAVFFILMSLAPKPKHGYAIMQDVANLSEQRVILSTGTLYGAVKRLLVQGWIEPVAEPEEDIEGAAGSTRKRKAYALTDLGRSILQAEANRMQNLVEIAQLQLA